MVRQVSDGTDVRRGLRHGDHRPCDGKSRAALRRHRDVRRGLIGARGQPHEYSNRAAVQRIMA